jgi:hypothetical protein
VLDKEFFRTINEEQIMIKIEINDANIRNHHFYLSKQITAFPKDVIGGANSTAAAPNQLKLNWPFGTPVFTDIAGDKNIFRQRGWVRELFERAGAEAGDFVVLKPIAPYEYEVDIEKGSNMSAAPTQSVGQTIQVQIKNDAWITRAKYEISNDLASFFPADALGARGMQEETRYPKRGKSVQFDYGMAGISHCDIATKLSGAMRPRESGPVRRLYEANQVKPGDVLLITRISERNYRVEVAR